MFGPYAELEEVDHFNYENYISQSCGGEYDHYTTYRCRTMREVQLFRSCADFDNNHSDGCNQVSGCYSISET